MRVCLESGEQDDAAAGGPALGKAAADAGRGNASVMS